MKFSLLINMKMPTIVGIFIFISRENFMLSWVEHENNFITFGPYDKCIILDKTHFSTKTKHLYLLHCEKTYLMTWIPVLKSDLWPWWLSWMRRPTGDQEVAGSTPAEVGNILSWRLIMKYFLRSFSPFRWFKKGSCQFLVKECAQYWLTA